MDIQVGDRVTYSLRGDIDTKLMLDRDDINDLDEVYIEILKIERPKYEVIEEKKELLTEEEKEFLKQYIKIIENLNNGKVIHIDRDETRIKVYLKTGLSYYMEVGPRFGNMEIDQEYTLSELRIGGIIWKLKYGDYVRTKYGIIDKVDRYSIGCSTYHCKNGMCIDECNVVATHLEDIVKHSKNIIDLIKAGDYVNGYEVRGKTSNYIQVNYYMYSEQLGEGHWLTISQDNIKSIVTKEQFVTMEYRLKEN